MGSLKYFPTCNEFCCCLNLRVSCAVMGLLDILIRIYFGYITLDPTIKFSYKDPDDFPNCK